MSFATVSRGRGCVIAAWLLLACAPALPAAPVLFESVKTSSFHGSKRDLGRVIDGLDANPTGWSALPQPGAPEWALFIAKKPFQAGRLRLSLCFLSGHNNSHFEEFSVSATSDPAPGVDSHWQPLEPVLAYSTGTQLTADPSLRLHSSGAAWNTVFVLETQPPRGALTALRVDVFAPATQTAADPSAAAAGNFVLTELRVEAFEAETTNVALGCAVYASHEQWSGFRAKSLTDGLAATFTHPRDPSLAERFFYEVDFGKERHFDHIALRNRGDGQVPERLSRVRLVLADRPAAEAGPVNWQALHRGDGSYPPAGGVDVIRATNGSGAFRGRYLRISSESPIAYSPQLAEVEAYEPLNVMLTGLRADELTMDLSGPVDIRAGTRWLAFGLWPSVAHLPPGLARRWRLAGYHEDWQPITREAVAEGPCPPPGHYRFEAQLAHSDGQWNDEVFVLPLTVLPPFWRQPYFEAGAAAVLGLAGIWLLRYWSRRRLARRVAVLEHDHALDGERARIARDMHDVVGARLTQWSVLHDIFAAEHALPAAATASLLRMTGTAREAITALDEVVWAINPRNDTLANVADYLCHCASEYFGPLEIPCRQDVPAEWAPCQVGAQTRHEVLLAFKEALQNVVKHAAATEVTLILRCTDGQLVVRLEDNGRGLPADSAGLEKDGLANMRARLQSVGGTCAVFARPAGGTVVEMRVPL